MNPYSLSHLTDQILLRDLAVLVDRDRKATAVLVAHIAEVDRRRLFRPAAHSSMFSYCVNVLHLSEQATFKRIRVARMARRFPAIFNALAEGRVHLSGLVMLKPYLTRESVDELLAAIEHKSSREITQLLADRFPKDDVPTRVRALPQTRAISPQLSSGTVCEPCATASGEPQNEAEPSVPRTEERPSAKTVAPAKIEPLSPKRYARQLTKSQDMHDKLRHTQALLSHQLPSGDVASVIERALDALIAKLEKAKFAATDRPRPIRESAKPRTIPANVKRAVRERDGYQCTFLSESGARCAERHFLEFDHVDEVARGGKATVDRIRLRCRAHNQYEAERSFGVAFMERKREEAQRASAERRGGAVSPT